MFKIVGTAVWICAITLASVHFSIQASSSSTAPEEATRDFFGGLDYVRGNVISVPVISGGAVEGYFLARLVFTAEPEKLRQLTIEPQDLITDELYSHLIGNETIDVTAIDRFDLAAFRTGVRDALNARVGETIFHDIIIEQIDYISKQEIRTNLQRRRPSATTAEDAAALDERRDARRPD